MGLFARLKTLFSKKGKKKSFTLGLALGSGGAKGMAHLGALKAFEDEGIKFDIVTGTSIGSIVGALYVKGYSSADMAQIVNNLNVKEFSKNLRPFADLGFAERFLENYLEGEIFDLPKPFAAWATDGDTNEGVLLSSGKTARALTASAAIPPFFRSVDIDGKKLYDGAFTNAVPADVCKQMGADFVIGIDLAAFIRSDEEKSFVTRFVGSAVSAFIPVKYKEDCRSRGYDAADIMLRPNLYGYRATDVNRLAAAKMYEIGYAEAQARMGEIKHALDDAGYRFIR